MTADRIPKSLDLPPDEVPDGLVIETRQPQPVPFGEESLEFHASRLLFLLKYAGGRKAKVTGRTKIAKLDFFVRYPTYLKKAAELKGFQADITADARPESTMIRYKYGPWDPKYYNVFALLVARGLITVEPSDKGDIFELTLRGQYVVEELSGPDFNDIVERCQLVKRLFGQDTGTAIKDFIYKNFPEVVAMSLGEEIG